MPTKAMKQGRKITRMVRSALVTQVAPAGKAVDEELAEAEQTPLGLDAAAISLAQLVNVALEGYAQAAQLVVTEVGEDGQARKGRDAPAIALYSNLSSLGEAVENAYGRPTAELLKLTGSTPTGPDELLTAANAFLAASQPMPPLPPPRCAWNAPNVAVARAEIVGQTQELDAALAHLATETRETQTARSQRDVAHGNWQRELRFATAIARAVLQRNDQADLAARLLPTERQITGSDSVEEDEQTVETSGAAEEESE